jgi:hypothetical protein
MMEMKMVRGIYFYVLSSFGLNRMVFDLVAGNGEGRVKHDKGLRAMKRCAIFSTLHSDGTDSRSSQTHFHNRLNLIGGVFVGRLALRYRHHSLIPPFSTSGFSGRLRLAAGLVVL